MAKTVSKTSKNPKKTAAVGDLFGSADKPQRASAKPPSERPARGASSAVEAGYSAKLIVLLEGF